MKHYYEISQNLQSLYHETGTNTKKLLDYIVGGIYCKDREIVDTLQHQRNIAKATWGLTVWEQELGLPDGSSLDTKRRRDIIQAKLNSNKRFLIDDLIQLVSQYSQGDVSVEELYEQFKLIIHLEGSRGEPEKLDQLLDILEELIPAHIIFELVFYFNTWEDLDGFDKTWSEWDDLDLTWKQLTTYQE